MSEVIFFTERLSISPFGTDDITDEYLEWLNSETLMRYSRQQYVKHDALSAKAFLKSFENTNNLFLLIKEKQTSIQVGTLTAYANPEERAIDLGIMIGNKLFQSRGIGSEAWIGLVTYARNAMPGWKITGGCNVHNVAMIKVFKKADMAFDHRKKSNTLFEGEYVDTVHYSVR